MEKEFETILYKAIAERGKDFLNNTSLCKALLNDYCKGQYKKEINVLVGAIEGKYIEKLILIREELSPVQLPILAEHFHDESGYTKELCVRSLEMLGNIYKCNQFSENIDGGIPKTPKYEHEKIDEGYCDDGIKRNLKENKIIEYSNGDKYEGQIENSIPSGQGKYMYADGRIYEGDFVKGKRQGKGKYTWTDGRVYIGDWLADDRTGQGKYRYEDGRIYEGVWIENKQTGPGRLTWPNGDKYIGNFINGGRTGDGLLTWSNGDKYKGNFLRNRIMGKGLLMWLNGDTYEGEFINNKISGYGKKTYKDGRIEEGVWENGELKRASNK